MATGKSFANIGVGEQDGYTQLACYDLKEASSQTYTLGAPLIRSAGYIKEAGANPATVYGFGVRPGQNGASDGAKNAKVAKALPGRRFTGTLSVTSLAEAMIGSSVNLVAASSTWYLNTATSISSAAQCKIEGPAPRFTYGDSMPEVVFTVIDDKIDM